MEGTQDRAEERTPVHDWITSSARPSSDGGIVRPSGLAVLMAGNKYAQSVQLGIRVAVAYPSYPEAPQRWDSWRLEATKTF